MHIFPLFALAMTISAASLGKRCSPAYDPELLHGYYPPAPCWQSFDTACRPYIAEGTDMTIDAKHNLTVVYGVSNYCQSDIVEELSRESDGRKNFGWIKKHGSLTLIKGNILVISNMSAETIDRYSKLTYEKH